MKIEIKKNPEGWDHDNVYLGEKGFGILSKDKKNVGLVKCPECEKENYAMAVMSGQCCWCGWQLKLEDVLLSKT